MAEEGALIGCHTVDEWNQVLQQANESQKLVMHAVSSPFDLCLPLTFPYNFNFLVQFIVHRVTRRFSVWIDVIPLVFWILIRLQV